MIDRIVSEIYPLPLEPVALEKPWGRVGETSFLDLPLRPDFMLGEAWLCADNGSFSSRVAGGPQGGAWLNRIKQLWGTALLGDSFEKRDGQPLPFQIKLIYTDGPGDVTRRETDGLWLFLSAPEGGRIKLDLINGCGPGGIEGALQDSAQWPVFLKESPVSTGELLYMPKGTVAALGPDMIILEIAQAGPEPTKLYDWGRPRRATALESLAAPKGKAVTAESFFDPRQAAEFFVPSETKDGQLLYSDTQWSLTMIEGANIRLHSQRELATVLVPLKGQGRLRSGGPSPVNRFSPGRAMLVPAYLGPYNLESSQPLRFLKFTANGGDSLC